MLEVSRIFFQELLVFGSKFGGWYYSPLAPLSWNLFYIFIGVFPLIFLLGKASEKQVETHPILCLLGWYVFGFVAQLVMRSLYPFPLGNIVESDTATSYLTVARDYDILDLLRNFHEILPDLPLHARANMPGKSLLFGVLDHLSPSLNGIGYGVIALANLGTFLIYPLVRDLFDSPRAGLYAAILFLFHPAKLAFFPIPNAITPVFFLALWLVLMRYLRAPHRSEAVFFGFILYGCLVFDALPFSAGILFLTCFILYLWQSSLIITDFLWFCLYTGVSFLGLNYLVMMLSGFDALYTLWIFTHVAVNFNEASDRPYWIWILTNLKDFFRDTGVIQSLLFGWLAACMGIKTVKEIKRGNNLVDIINHNPISFLAFTILVNILVLNFLGFSRGEVTRLWIFWGVAVQAVIAAFCATKRPRVFWFVCGMTVLQSIVTTNIIAFVIP